MSKPMATIRSTQGRALFYSRDSSGKHEMTPAQYVQWAQRETQTLGLTFDGTGEQILQLIRSDRPSLGDLFFDNAVKGNCLERPGLDALKAEIQRDKNVSHVLIPRRDRLARPDQSTQGVVLETELRQMGVALHFMDLQLPPMSSRERLDLAESLAAMLDYHQSGKFRDELAEKMIFAQLELAKRGFSTGGRAPFGFRRFLIGPDRTPILELQDNETVRRPGHHVAWLPGPQEELDLICRIVSELESLPASQLVRKLNAEGIPSPDAGRQRRDGDVLHAVSGRWNHPTIINIARNPLLRAVTRYGLRSMGEQRRLTPEGPRVLDDDKDLGPEKQIKVIRNDPSQWITAQAYGDAVVPVDQAERLIEILDQRAGTQRGKPRSRDPGKNPLGTRVFDMACGWPMYRIPSGNDSFRYTCGSYQQSHGLVCSHNHADGIQLTQFALATIRQRLLRPGLRDRLEAKLQHLFQDRAAQPREPQRGRETIRQELADLKKQYDTALNNMTLETDAGIRNEMRQIVVGLQGRMTALQAEAQHQESMTPNPPTVENKVAAALRKFDELPQLAEDPNNLAAIGELFRQVDVQIFLRFEPVKLTKRTVNRLANGIITLGAVTSPIAKYSGATSSSLIKGNCKCPKRASSAETTAELAENPFPDAQAKSSRNVNRDDRI